MKEVKLEVWDEEHIGYLITDFDGHVYGVIDNLDEKGDVYDTTVVDYETLDEIEDPELWKRIINARAKNATTLKELLESEKG